MGDVEDSPSLGAELADDSVEPPDLGLAQRRGRLVEDQHPGIAVQGPCDLNQLPIADRQTPHPGLRPEAETERVEKDLRAFEDRLPGDDRRKLVEHQVLGHRQFGEKGQLLVDHRDPGRVRVPRVRERAISPVDHDAPVEGSVRPDAAQDLHQGGFSGPVFAHQGEHLAPMQLQADRVERTGAGKILGDRLEPKELGGSFSLEDHRAAQRFIFA